MKGIIFDIKELGIHDGNGLIETIFLKGCPLKCMWCHNPEGQSFKKEIMVRNNSCKHCGLCYKECNHPECQPYKRCLHICPDNLIKEIGEEIEAYDLAKRILKNINILEGVTFSGGEPLSQSEFLLEVISYLDGLKINIETSGYVNSEIFKKIIDKADLIYLDIKLADDELHKKYTGVSNKLILDNLKIIKQSNCKCIIRTPLIPSITDTKENINAIKELIGDLPHELLPYNEMASVKYSMLNRKYPLDENKEAN